jgi:hypothetical protein
MKRSSALAPGRRLVVVFTLNFILLLFASGIFASGWVGNNAGAAFHLWPDTGQQKCYDNYSGQVKADTFY